MDYSLDQRTASLSIGEFSEFNLGPRNPSSSYATGGLWRAQLGTHWHNQLRTHATAADPSHEFEVPISGQIFHRGWTLTLTGRIDQRLVTPQHILLREIKTTLRALPADETELRTDHPSYFAQLSTYLALTRLSLSPHASNLPPPLSGELVFVEAGSGLSQTIPVGPSDDRAFQLQLERVTEFLEHLHRSRERLRSLYFHSPFPTLRPGQETTQADLAAALERQPIVYFEAPTGFGKTGALLEAALTRLHAGHHDRLIYLTSKSTGQLQVVATLQSMTAPPESAPITHNLSPITSPLGIWHIRNKREHCINSTFHCSTAHCSFLLDHATRFAASGLSRLYLQTHESRTMENLHRAGRHARICPYEITRAALPFSEVWIGDYNYLFSPSSRSFFAEQPGYDPARTLLILDEAHNLPTRAADAHSHRFDYTSAVTTRENLASARAPQNLLRAWDEWTYFLKTLPICETLRLAAEDDARDLINTVADLVPHTALDPLATEPDTHEALWALTSLATQLRESTLPLHWWSPRAGELHLTCLDAAPAIAPILRSFGRVLLATATLGPTDAFTAALGLDQPPPDAEPISHLPSPITSSPKFGTLNKRETKKLFAQLTTGTALLSSLTPDSSALAPPLVRASTPWRENAYDLGIDLRADTTFQRRSENAPLTAETLLALLAASRRENATAPIAAFFPSYAYAELIQRELTQPSETSHLTPHTSPLCSLQPRNLDLSAQTAWLETALTTADILFFVLGSSFSEGIDLLGGRITHALVAGPALPEVNPIQRARLAHHAPLGRDAAFNRVYQVPGMQKVNQAIGRLVRAPGQHAKILLHCRRFAEPSYQNLLPNELSRPTPIPTETELRQWLTSG